MKKLKFLSCILAASICLTGAAMPPADTLEEIDTTVIAEEELTEIGSSETPLLETEEDIYDDDIVESDESLQDKSTAETDLELEDAEPSAEKDTATEETVQDEIADEQTDEESAEFIETEQPGYIPEELAVLLATNQADSMMGGLGMARNESCTQVVAVFTLSDYTQNPVMDANYATLWMDMNAAFQSIAETSSANCIYDNGTITILKQGDSYEKAEKRRIPRPKNQRFYGHDCTLGD